MGLGHVRRNMLIAQVLSKSYLEPNILLLSGVQEAENFPLPPGVDRAILPSLYKEKTGQYRSRRLRMSLNEIISLRRRILQTSITAFDPDLMIVDGVPWGAVGELDSTLEYLLTQGHTRFVLGMRDIWDEPEAISQEWRQRKNWDAIQKYYDQIWVYGDPNVYDAIQEYNLDKNVASKVRYTGYLDQVARLELVSYKDRYAYSRVYDTMKQDGPFALCLLGGGQDATQLAEAFIDAELPRDISRIVVTGPYMDQEDREKLLVHAAKKKSLVRIFDFVPEPNVLLQLAEYVVSMGGYNTICAIISFRKRALVVPRVVPRKEQLIRAERLKAHGILEFVHPDNLKPEEITTFIENSKKRTRPAPIHINMSGLECVVDLAESLLGGTEICERNSKSMQVEVGHTNMKGNQTSSNRVAYVCTDPGVPVFGSKGASVHVQELVSAFVRLGANVKLFVCTAGGEMPSWLDNSNDRRSIEFCQLHDWPKGNEANVGQAVEAANKKLRSVLEEAGPFDLVYERYSLWSYAAMEYANSMGIPGLLEVNAPLIEEQARYRSLQDRESAENVARRAFTAARLLFAVSRGVANYLNASYHKETNGKVHLMPNAVNPIRFPEKIRSSLPAKSGIFTVGFVGSLKPWHGLNILVEALSILIQKDAHHNIRLLIVGDGPEREKLVKDLTDRNLLEDTEFTGKVDPSEIPGLLASMDVSVAPYPDLDDFYFSPLKIYEYMAAGLPVIASRIGDLPELIKDGINGFLVPPGDSISLAAVLSKLKSDRDLRLAVGSRARTTVFQSHTWDNNVRRILDLSRMEVTAQTSDSPRLEQEGDVTI
jgi:predicted glycosyltransferase/glycosyltransferase involved in cell wall biosynthesis